MAQSYIVGEAKTDDSEKKRKSNAAAIGVLLGVLVGAGIHKTLFPLGIAELAILGVVGGVVVRFALLPVFSKN
tara:strand:+ start:1945 stop:2163 length:219 start_codon:yes stop_codon:yes gene_type:complete